MFAIGDIVRLNEAGLSMKSMTPKTLVQAGYPNRFEVKGVFDYQDPETGNDGQALELSECCGQTKDVESGNFLCLAHPAKFFDIIQTAAEKIGESGPRPVAEISIDTPIGRALHLGHYRIEGGSEMVLELPFIGPFRVRGPVADDLAKILKERGVL